MYIIPSFISDFEASAIVSASRARMATSSVGDQVGGVKKITSVRNSENAWLARHTSSVMDSLFRRAADVIGVDETLLTESRAAESLQVVHYAVGQKYDTHVDWVLAGVPNSRHLTLLIYLESQPDPTAGGETAFPHAHIKVHPKKGMAVMFYNLLADGNADSNALHAALPVEHGEKAMANFWVWDPLRLGDPSASVHY